MKRYSVRIFRDNNFYGREIVHALNKDAAVGNVLQILADEWMSDKPDGTGSIEIVEVKELLD